MPQVDRPLDPPIFLDRMPVSADDIVAMIMDVLCDYLPPDSGISPRDALGHLMEIAESPLAIEIYEKEVARRQPRDVDSWH